MVMRFEHMIAYETRFDIILDYQFFSKLMVLGFEFTISILLWV